jgi:hypothetical protein
MEAANRVELSPAKVAEARKACRAPADEAVGPATTAKQGVAVTEQAWQLASQPRSAKRRGGAVTGFLDSGASHNQLNNDAMRKLLPTTWE